MRLARRVLGPDGTMLLNQGTVLQERFIRYLDTNGFTRVYVSDERIGELPVEDVVSDGARRDALAAAQAVQVRVQAARGGVLRLPVAPLTDAVSALLHELRGGRDRLIAVEEPRALSDGFSAHAVNVCMLSLLIGLDLNYSSPRLVQLGLGALLHDIGLAPLWSKAPTDGTGPDSPSEGWQDHPRRGFQLLRRCGQFSARAMAVALQHHEALDGSGFPNGLRGDAIHEFARAVAVADVYDNLVFPKSGRPAVPVTKAVAALRSARETTLEEAAVDALVSHIAPHPIGFPVRLAQGESGIVVSVGTRKAPTLTVRVLRDSLGRELAAPVDVRVGQEGVQALTTTDHAEQW